MLLSYEKLTSTYAFFLLLMDDHEKSSSFLFKMVDECSSDFKKGEEEFNSIREFVLDIVEIISLIDPEYSESMAATYYGLVTEKK